MKIWEKVDIEGLSLADNLSDKMLALIVASDADNSILNSVDTTGNIEFLKTINENENLGLNNSMLMLAHLLGGGYKDISLGYLILFKQIVDSLKNKNQLQVLKTPIPLRKEFKTKVLPLLENDDIDYSHIFKKYKTGEIGD